MFENVDGRTDAGDTGILIAHLGAFGSGELKIRVYCTCRCPYDGTKMIKCVNCSEWLEHPNCLCVVGGHIPSEFFL